MVFKPDNQRFITGQHYNSGHYGWNGYCFGFIISNDIRLSGCLYKQRPCHINFADSVIHGIFGRNCRYHDGVGHGFQRGKRVLHEPGNHIIGIADNGILAGRHELFTQPYHVFQRRQGRFLLL
jgi:hypothetical protein